MLRFSNRLNTAIFALFGVDYYVRLSHIMRMEPAKTIIDICGGVNVVADMVSRSETRVRRWTYPVDRGGTGGIIPSDVQQALLDEAVKRGLPLTPTHFFPNFSNHKPTEGAA